MKRLLPLTLMSTCLFAVGCSADGSEAAAPDTGGTVVVVVPSDPATLFPPALDGTTDREIASAMFDRLAEIGDNLNTVGDSGFAPRLAASWEWAKDSLSIAFHLNPRARWHDGVPVRAEDVRYSWQVYADSSSGSKAVSLFANIDSCSVADSMTAVFWYKRRTPQQFYDATYNMFVIPSHILAKVPMRDLMAHPFSHAPVGTGRFRFVRWDPQARIEILSDTGNYRGRAKLDRVIWSIAGDAGAAPIKLFSGDGDVLEKFPPSNIPQLVTSPTLRLVPVPTFSYEFLVLNLRARRSTREPHPVLGDVRVRQALSMAVDRDRIIRTVLDSLATPAIGPAPRALFPWASALHGPHFDAAHARALLDSAGWTDPAKTGVRTKNGVPLAFELLASSTVPVRVSLATLMQEQFKDVGAQVSVLQIPGKAIHERVDKRDWDAFMSGLDMNPGLLGMPQTWSTSAIGDLNYGAYSNPKFDALLDSAIASFDRRRAPGLWTRAFQQILDDAPAIWLHEARNAVVMHRRIRPTLMRPDALFAGLADWTIDPAQRIKRDNVGLRGAR